MTWLKLMVVVLLAMTLGGCDLAGGIYNAGAWVGALGVLIVVVAIAFIALKIKR